VVGTRDGPLARFAGLRTFLSSAALGGVAGWFALHRGDRRSSRSSRRRFGADRRRVRPGRAAGGHSVEGTTEVAALLVLALGVLAGLGFLELASGSAAIMVLVLSEKARLRALVTRIGEERAARRVHCSR
jgi:hypothetical protein